MTTTGRYSNVQSMTKPKPPREPNNGTRVNLTLPPEVVAILDSMGAVTGAGRATIIREFLIDAVPHLAQLAQALNLAQSKNMDAFKVMAQVAQNVANTGDQLVLDIRKANRAARRKKQP